MEKASLQSSCLQPIRNLAPRADHAQSPRKEPYCRESTLRLIAPTPAILRDWKSERKGKEGGEKENKLSPPCKCFWGWGQLCLVSHLPKAMPSGRHRGSSEGHCCCRASAGAAEGLNHPKTQGRERLEHRASHGSCGMELGWAGRQLRAGTRGEISLCFPYCSVLGTCGAEMTKFLGDGRPLQYLFSAAMLL